MTQDTNEATIKTFKFDTDIGAFLAVVQGAGEDHCALGAAADAAGFLGFTMDSVLSGMQGPIHMDGGIAKATLGGTVADKDFLVISGATGKLKKGGAGQNVVAQAQRAGVDGDVIPVLIVRGARIASAAFRSLYAAGLAAPGAVALAGAKVGDQVIAAANLTDGTAGEAAFETVITVANQIQQSSVTDLHAKNFHFLLAAQS